MPSTWPACSIGPSRRGRLSSTSATLASKTSPKLLISFEPASSPQYATGTCSVSVTRSLFGKLAPHHRLRTHGTDSKAVRARARSMVKKLPFSLRRHVGAQRDRVVVRDLAVDLDAAQRKERLAQHPPRPRGQQHERHRGTEREVRHDVHELDVEGQAGMLSAMAIANLPWRRAWPRPAPQAQVFVGMPAARADIGTSEWLVMPGEVFISSRKGLRSLARIITSARPQPRQPSVR
jgi:hypothetical protein